MSEPKTALAFARELAIRFEIEDDERPALADMLRDWTRDAQAQLTVARTALEAAEDLLSDWWNCMGDGTNKGPFPGLVADTAALVPKLRAALTKLTPGETTTST